MVKNILVLHPFFFCLFPVFYIYSKRKETLFTSTLIPAIVILVSILSLWFLMSLLVKNKEKKAVLLSVFLLFFFSFGYAFKTIKPFLSRSFPYDYTIFFVVWATFLITFLWLIIRFNRDLAVITASLNIMAASLLIFLVIDISPLGEWFGFNRFQLSNNMEKPLRIPQKDLITTRPLPNIYYIILDGYGRADILKEFYQLDNQEFIRFLKDKGFFVAEKSRSNYPQTALSLSSSLNFQYVPAMFTKMDTLSDDRSSLAKLIRHNNLFHSLKQHNYTIITFSSGKAETEINNSDLYLEPRWSLPEFEHLLINSTPLSIILKGLQYNLHRERILFILEHLGKLPVGDRPFLAFAHIIAPHPPFILGEKGEPKQPNRNFSLGDGDHFTQNASRAEYVDSYKKEVIYLNTRIKELVQTILANSSRPSIIVLQSDHGPGSYLEWRHPENTNLNERMSNFIACYFPDQKTKMLYPTITPVNIFRIVLNQYFGDNYPLLKDEVYFATLGRPYRLEKVTDKIDKD